MSIAEYRESLKWFSRALKEYDRLELPRKQSMVYLNRGITFYKIGDYENSYKSLHRSLRIGVELDWIHRQMFANIALGNVYRLNRDFSSARQHLHAAYNQAQELRMAREESLALEFLGDVYRDEGQPAEARRFYARALAIGKRLAPEGDIVMEIHRRMGECHYLEGDPAKAMPELGRALVLSREQNDRYEEAVILRVMAETSYSIGDLVSARRHVDQSVTILDGIGARHEHAISMLRSSEIALAERDARGDEIHAGKLLNKAWDRATAALDLFIKVDVPWWTEKAGRLVDRISAERAARERAAGSLRTSQAADGSGKYNPGDVIIHTASRMRDLVQLCDMFAATDEPVLVTGETGTGKELFARRLHDHSKRHKHSLVAVNVAAIPSSLFEREFFGHVRGSFSGADRDGQGFAGRASGGTLFLDEIGDLPLDSQPKLLRLLQEGTYQTIGDPQERHADIRLVAATNADLGRLVKEGRFRADLYYRLKILELALPPVRERQGDAVPLMRHFLSIAAGRPVDLPEYFNGPSMELVQDYEWPGNVREIATVARRAQVDLVSRGQVSVELPGTAEGVPRILTGPHLLEMAAVSAGFTGSDEVERSRILMALDECGGNRLGAARLLGLSRSTLYRRMEKFGIQTRKS